MLMRNMIWSNRNWNSNSNMKKNTNRKKDEDDSVDGWCDGIGDEDVYCEYGDDNHDDKADRVVNKIIPRFE